MTYYTPKVKPPNANPLIRVSFRYKTNQSDNMIGAKAPRFVLVLLMNAYVKRFLLKVLEKICFSG